jgi:hypothetical protein
MSIVPGRDVPEVPQAWVDAVNQAVNDANHEDLCSSLHALADCDSYRPGTWDIGVDLTIAVGVLEPLIRDRIAMESRKPSKAVVARQLKAAGHEQAVSSPSRAGFQVAVNPSITPDGVAVLYRFGESGPAEDALESYAVTLCSLGYDARVEGLARTELRGVYVRRSAK